MDQLSHYVISTAFLTSTLALMTPLAFAALGGVVSERAGVVNIALEGMMLAGAFGSILVVARTGDMLLGVLAGMGASAAIGLLHALFGVWGRINQIVSGISLNLFSLGLTALLASLVFTDPPKVATMGPARIPVLHSIPALGPSLFSQTPLFYVLIGLCIVVWLVLARTRAGLALRAAGESAGAAASAGLRTGLIRTVAVVCCGLIAGLGGVFIALAQSGSFSEDMTGGLGYLAFALLVFCNRRPFVVLVVALVFGAIQAVALELQVVAPSFPPQFMQMIPHLITVVVFVTVGARAFPPSELGRRLAVRG